MSRRRLESALCLSLLGTLMFSTAAAAARGPGAPYVGGGYAWRVNGMAGNDWWTSGLGVTAGFALWRSDIHDWLLSASYGELGFDRASLVHYTGSDAASSDGAARFVSATVMLRLRPASRRLRPYLDLGLGAERTWIPAVQYSRTPGGSFVFYSARRTNATVTIGVGADCPASARLAVFADLHAWAIQMPGDRAYPAILSLGLRLR